MDVGLVEAIRFLPGPGGHARLTSCDASSQPF